jgi:hypothetical protein
MNDSRINKLIARIIKKRAKPLIREDTLDLDGAVTHFIGIHRYRSRMDPFLLAQINSPV